MTGWLLASLLSAAPAAVPHRFVLAVGTNEGDASDVALEFAEADARRVSATLTDVGGVDPANVALLTGADASALEAALSHALEVLRSRGTAGDELVVYVSAHADEGNLHLRGTHFPLARLREEVLGATADVAFLVLDTCQSGALTRVKGLRPVDGVAVHAEAPGLKGRVIITSSGPDEFAQESAQLEGSYFTYHWTTGLRGPADASHDGRVTLQEAYDYAYARTVESTFANPAGVQHPNFLVDLKGEGELVLSETAGPKTHLLIAVEAPGEWLVLSERGDSLLGRFQKSAGPATFALAPGSYRLRMRASDGFWEGHVTVAAGGYSVVRESDLTVHTSDEVALKGPSEVWTLGIAATTGPPLVSAASWLAGGQLVVERRAALLGPLDVLLASAAFRASTRGAGSILENETDVRVGVGARARRGAWRGLVAAEVGGLGVYQSRVPNGPLFGVEGLLGARAELSVQLRSLLPFVFVDGGAVLMRTDAGRSVGWTASAGLGCQLPF